MTIIISEPTIYTEFSVDDIASLAPLYGGFYYFYDKYGDVIYIGKTKCFRSRLMTHAREAVFFIYAVKVRVFHVMDEVDRDIYETYFINQYRPQYNIAKKWETAEEIDYYKEITIIEEQIAELEEERADIMEEIDACKTDEDGHNFYTDYYDDTDRLRHEFGTDLIAAERLPEIDAELSRLKSRLRHVKSFVF